MILNGHNLCSFKSSIIARLGIKDISHEDECCESILNSTWTFDDALSDMWIIHDILARHNISYRLFICPGLIDDFEQGSIGRVRRCLRNEQASLLHWGQIREMTKRGACIGSHSVDHPFFDELSDKETMYQLKTSKEMIQDRLGLSIDTFAFPYGFSRGNTARQSAAALKFYDKVYWSDNSLPVGRIGDGVYNRRHAEFGVCTLRGRLVGALNLAGLKICRT